MGKTKQVKEGKKFDRNVEISAPILDPEIIKAIHSPPKGQRLDIKYGGFKALLSDLNSQDSTDELTPLNDNHVPSYIGISCAVSGYSNYSSYTKRSSSPTPLSQQATSKTTLTDTSNANHLGQFNSNTPNRSRTASPISRQAKTEVHHITIDKNNIHSADEERKELTEKLTSSATERRHTPSPITPTEDDRHHGTYVGARYCPLPPPSKIVNKHIPLLGIDDDKDPDEVVEDENKVEQKIASLYGDDFVEDWRESMTHKAKKEHEQVEGEEQNIKTPKDLVVLKPTPVVVPETSQVEVDDIPTPNAKVLAGVEKKFLNKLLTDENPPMPSSPSPVHQSEVKSLVEKGSAPQSPIKQVEDDYQEHEQQQQASHSPQQSPALSPVPPMSPDSGKSQSFAEEELVLSTGDAGQEQHIEYEIRAQSPVDNESSPVKHREQYQEEHNVETKETARVHFEEDKTNVEKLVSYNSPNLDVGVDKIEAELKYQENKAHLIEPIDINKSGSDSNDGHYYLGLLDQEKSFISEQVERAERILINNESELEEDIVGRIRSAIGKANLLLNKKCNQFKELCEANINRDPDEQFATLNDDLAGFWDMLTLQIDDIKKSFEALWEEERNNWNVTKEEEEGGIEEKDTKEEKVEEKSAAAVAKSAGLASVKPKLSAQKDQERRERLQEHINQMKQSQASKVSEENLLEIEPTAAESLNDQVEKEAEEQLVSLVGGFTEEESPVENLEEPTIPIRAEPPDTQDLVDFS